MWQFGQYISRRYNISLLHSEAFKGCGAVCTPGLVMSIFVGGKNSIPVARSNTATSSSYDALYRELLRRWHCYAELPFTGALADYFNQHHRTPLLYLLRRFFFSHDRPLAVSSFTERVNLGKRFKDRKSRGYENVGQHSWTHDSYPLWLHPEYIVQAVESKRGSQNANMHLLRIIP